MITYKYKLYSNKRNRRLGRLMAEACFVWNRCLALQKRYYSLYNSYIPCARMQKHFAKRYKMAAMHSQSVQEVIQRLDAAYRRFFERKAKRPPKFKRRDEMSSVVYKQGGFVIKGNKLTINKIKTTFKFSLSRPMKGLVKRVSVKRSALGDYYLCVVTDAEPKRYGKTHDGASVGIDFGMKTYLTLSDGKTVENPQFMKRDIRKLRRASRWHSVKKKGSNNRERSRKGLDRLHESIVNRRADWQWKLSHELCMAYDNIYLEDLCLEGMRRRKNWGRKMSDLAHGRFVEILKAVAEKYGCMVWETYRFYPSSKTCGNCGLVYRDLRLKDRSWTCPECGTFHDRDLNAARNILRRGIAESVSACKTNGSYEPEAGVSEPRIPLL